MKITDNKLVTIEYSLKDSNKINIDNSKESGPFSYLHGMDQTLPGMEDILDGQEVGFTFDGEIPCEKAYGKRDKEQFIPVPKEEFEDVADFEVGMSLSIMNNYDEPQEMEIMAIGKDTVTIDANGPYVDMDIKFTCKVIEVRDATAEELKEAQEEHDHECGCGCGDEH
ncbi:MAG: FKBP-type peptidyl-prolyl cis-trans isomerase [Spirochaetaceae bacterium]